MGWHSQSSALDFALSCAIWDGEKGKREQIWVHVEVVYRLANMFYKSSAGRVSLQLQGQLLAGFLVFAELHSGVTQWFSTKSHMLWLKGEESHTWWIKKKKVLRFLSFSWVQTAKTLVYVCYWQRCFSEFCYRLLFRNPEFYLQLSYELLGDFFNYIPIFLISVISILKSAFIHCH